MTALQTISIVIPVRNGRRFLAACLDSLLAEQARALELTCEIIVVDNASEDNSADFVAQHYPNVRLSRNVINQGFAGGCNRGVEAATGDAVVLLNQDTNVHAGWMSAIAQAFADPAVGIIGCKLLYPDGKTLQHAGGWIEWPQGHGYHYGHHELDQGQCDESRPVEWVTGAALAIRREVLQAIGLLDENFWPGYFEDVDYCLRTRSEGYQVWYCAEAVVTHQETSSLIERSAVIRFYQRGRLRMTLKHLPPQRWLDEFIPAEEAYFRKLGLPDQLVLQTAYVETIPSVLIVLLECWQTSGALVYQIIDALQNLAQANWSPTPHLAEWTPRLPLTEFEFHSSTPVIGGLVSTLRRFWYHIAARWADHHLQQQQERINWQYEHKLLQQQRRLQQYERHLSLLQSQIDQVVLKNAALAQQLAQLQPTNNLPAESIDQGAE